MWFYFSSVVFYPLWSLETVASSIRTSNVRNFVASFAFRGSRRLCCCWHYVYPDAGNQVPILGGEEVLKVLEARCAFPRQCPNA